MFEAYTKLKKVPQNLSAVVQAVEDLWMSFQWTMEPSGSWRAHMQHPTKLDSKIIIKYLNNQMKLILLSEHFDITSSEVLGYMKY